MDEVPTKLCNVEIMLNIIDLNSYYLLNRKRFSIKNICLVMHFPLDVKTVLTDYGMEPCIVVLLVRTILCRQGGRGSETCWA
jgi:hypothetical protein